MQDTQKTMAEILGLRSYKPNPARQKLIDHGFSHPATVIALAEKREFIVYGLDGLEDVVDPGRDVLPSWFLAAGLLAVEWEFQIEMVNAAGKLIAVERLSYTHGVALARLALDCGFARVLKHLVWSANRNWHGNRAFWRGAKSVLPQDLNTLGPTPEGFRVRVAYPMTKRAKRAIVMTEKRRATEALRTQKKG